MIARLSYRILVLGAALGMTATGCDLSSNPTPQTLATLSGTITYSGSRPVCDDEDVNGQLVLQLLAGPDADPWSDAWASQPITNSFKVIPGEDLFTTPNDCGSGGPAITREVPFTFENAGPTTAVEAQQTYRLVAFWDVDESFVAADPLLNRPTRGDRLGGAFEMDRRFQPISFTSPGVVADPEMASNLNVLVDAEVHSELPMFRFGTDRKPLSSEQVFPLEDDPMLEEDAVYALTDTTIELLPLDTEPYVAALVNAGLSVESDPVRRGFFSFPVDPQRTGTAARHPLSLMTRFDLEWHTPAPVLRREQTEAERATGVPDVYIFPTTRPSVATKELFSPSMDLLVYPVAFMDLNPDVAVCRVPIVAPGNPAPYYEGIATDCQELPTGHYSVSVSHGTAGGETFIVERPDLSDTGFRVTGGEFTAQSWTIPNELSDFLIDQGQAGRFLVTDPDPDNGPDPLSTTAGHGTESCVMAPDPEMEDMTRTVGYMAVPPACCEPVAHLCGIPLCEPQMTGSTGAIREATSREGTKPSCLPFLMPPSCCLGS